jgi:predicted O-methyltransferase YrrM
MSAALTTTRQELTQRTREYRALRYSRLGRMQVGYWRVRRKLAGWKAATVRRLKSAGQGALPPRDKESAMRRLSQLLVRIKTIAVLVAVWLAGALALGLAVGAGAVPTVALMALGPLLGGLLLQVRHSADLASRIDVLTIENSAQGQQQLQALAAGQAEHMAELQALRATVEPLTALPGRAELDEAILRGTLDTTRRLKAAMDKEIKQTFHQLEALQNLSAVLPVKDVLPATRGWAASPDLLLVLVDLVVTGRPSLVVECGSGASTLWLALAMRRFGIDGKIIALDHDPDFANNTRDFLARHDVLDLAEVRDAPLESFSLDGEAYPWYARRAWQDLTGIDLLFVDGPPADTGHQARYPALPLLRGSLSPAATVVADDLVVPDMQKAVRLWLDAYPEFSSQTLPLEKQAAVLRRG